MLTAVGEPLGGIVLAVWSVSTLAGLVSTVGMSHIKRHTDMHS